MESSTWTLRMRSRLPAIHPSSAPAGPSARHGRRPTSAARMRTIDRSFDLSAETGSARDLAGAHFALERHRVDVAGIEDEELAPRVSDHDELSVLAHRIDPRDRHPRA